jgi:predicted ATPase
MPLAIELAAARVQTLSVQQIAGRLDDRFHLLTSASRTTPTRQQTLEATLAGFTLLSETEQKLLSRSRSLQALTLRLRRQSGECG